MNLHLLYITGLGLIFNHYMRHSHCFSTDWGEVWELTRRLRPENICSQHFLHHWLFLLTCGDSCNVSGMSLEIVYHLWHMDYTCRQYDSRESESWVEKTPIHPEIECRIRIRMRSFKLFVLRPLTSGLLIKANDNVKTGLPSNVMSTYFFYAFELTAQQRTMSPEFYLTVCGLCIILRHLEMRVTNSPSCWYDTVM